MEKMEMAYPEMAEASTEVMQDVIISMAVESWRFSQTFERLVKKLDAGEQNRYVSQLNWFIKKINEALEKVDLKFVELEGHPFDIGMAATPLNIEEFDAEKDTLVVDKMLEPTIMGKDGLVRTGTITLRRA
jgi:hypothetical protein